jgi:outer membrane protein assembly factor BamB
VAYPTEAGTIVVFAAPAAECPGGGTAGLAALLVLAAPRPSMRPIWCAALDAIRPVPIITTTDGRADSIVWVVGGSGDNRLHAFRADTGETVFAGGIAGDRMSGLGHFATILAAEDALYVAGHGRLYAFRVDPR